MFYNRKELTEIVIACFRSKKHNQGQLVGFLTKLSVMDDICFINYTKKLINDMEDQKFINEAYPIKAFFRKYNLFQREFKTLGYSTKQTTNQTLFN